MTRLIFIAASIALSMLAPQARAQVKLEGVVLEEKRNGSFTPLEYVNISLLGTDTGTYTDSSGYFVILLPEKAEGSFRIDRLVVSYVGYAPDTINVTDQQYVSIVLKDDNVLDEVEVVARKRSSEISFLDPRLVENISREELFKAACCNLSESFETNASIDVTFTDAITGAKELQMLGLDGKYTMISREFMPGIRGLALPYGLLYTPGSWIESMQVTKGAGSVVNGYESIAGQINVEWKKPESNERLFVNGYINGALRNELNANGSLEINSRLSTELLGHVSHFPRLFDRNDDGFADLLEGTLYVVGNRWNYNSGTGLVGQLGVVYTSDDKKGGELDFNPSAPEAAYGVLRDTRRVDAWGKTGYVFPAKKYQSLGFQWSYSYHDQDMRFGPNLYDGTQQTAYGNLIFQTIIGNTDHKIKTGLSVLYDHYREELNGGRWGRDEVATGAFVEYTYTTGDNFTAVAGGRLDHNSIYGLLFTPRLHLRYRPAEMTTVRASFGRGFRSPNVIAENLSLLASSRRIDIRGNNTDLPLGLEMESAWNFGFSVLQRFRLMFREGTASAEFFRTSFENQVVVDLDISPQEAVIYNLDGMSFSNNVQTEVAYELLKRLDVKLAYRWSQVRTDYSTDLLAKPLVPLHRGFANVGYRTRQGSKGFWMFDGTMHVTGKQRLPNTSTNPEGLQRPDWSPAFVTFSMQITRAFDVGRSGTATGLDVYIGAENLFDFRQDDPIIAADDPFGPYFDSGLVWGPIFGRMLYAGVRYTLDKRDN